MSMSTAFKRAETEGSQTFNPHRFFQAWEKGEIGPPSDNDFRKFIIQAFDLPADDDYGYQAIAEVSLAQAQTYVEMGAQNGLHKWYMDDEKKQLPAPPAIDISAYSEVFRASTNTTSALKQLASNAKKGSIRADVAKHLTSLHSPNKKFVVPKSRTHVNPYLDLWEWTNQNLEWAGPIPDTVKIHHSHPILPILFHHFGCVCPSYEALEIIRQAANGRDIFDIGSGNGYWTFMLRRMRDAKNRWLTCDAIDLGISEWRTMWVDGTIPMDSVKFLQKHDHGVDAVLLMVYPSVSNAFTAKTIAAYHGTTIIIAGSQNANGFTAFREPLVDWFAREMPKWQKLCQVPLPSFAGKDEALFVYEKQQ